MNNTLFEQLINRPESTILDFKETSFSFSINKEQEDAKFLKDVLSFSNTIRQESAYIISGIRNTNGQNIKIGISSFPDDAILQQKAMDKAHPKPVFKSYIYHYENLAFGIIEIPLHSYQEPLCATIKLKGLEPGKIYTRRGSSNSEATGREILAINEWFKSLKIKAINLDPFQNEITELIHNLSQGQQTLSSCFTSGLKLSMKISIPLFENFCINELTGYNNQEPEVIEKTTYRTDEVIVSPYEVEINPYNSINGAGMMKFLKSKQGFYEMKMFFNQPLVELEAIINRLSANNNKALATFTADAKSVFPNANIPSGKVTIYTDLNAYLNVYEKIRKTAIRELVLIQSNFK